MDRDKRWDRVQKAYDTIVAATGERFTSAMAAIEKAMPQALPMNLSYPAPSGIMQA